MNFGGRADSCNEAVDCPFKSIAGETGAGELENASDAAGGESDEYVTVGLQRMVVSGR
jgi:hypothetical protein